MESSRPAQPRFRQGPILPILLALSPLPLTRARLNGLKRVMNPLARQTSAEMSPHLASPAVGLAPGSASSPPAQPITVSIVDDDPGVRKSIGDFINDTPGFSCLSRHATAEAALRHLPRENPNVVLMDIHLAGMSGIECAQKLKAAAPEIQIVMLTACEDAPLIFRALAAGATGYILKRAPADKLLRAIADVQSGGSPMTSSIARQVVASFQKPPTPTGDAHHLTAREQSILDCLSKGLTYQQTADRLAISIGTLRTHVRRIYDKLQVHARTEAVAKYMAR